MARERSQSDQYLDTCRDILESLMLFSIPVIQHKIWNIDFLLAIRSILDYDCSLHRLHYQIQESEIQKLYTKGPGQQWRNKLEIGDKVDALLHYYDLQRGNSRGAGWSQATIIDIDEDKLTLNYILDQKMANRKLARWSNELAQFESETKDIWEWKATLKEGDLIDAQDDTYHWRQSTIVKIYEINEGEKVIPMCVVGLRVYQANGSRSDEIGKYEGFGARFDEKIPLYSPKIAKYRTMSTKDKSDMDGELDETLDDYIDPLEGYNKVWAVPRPRKCTSRAYLQILSSFCEAGGLHTIL